MLGSGAVVVQDWIEGGAQIADPAMLGKRQAIVRRGKMNPAGRRGGGYSPAANMTTAPSPEAMKAFYDKRQQAALQQGVTNVHLDSLALPTLAGYAQAGTSATAATTTTPTVTYSNTAASKSYTPSQVTLGASSVSGPFSRLG